jgi:hypothetical protein
VPFRRPTTPCLYQYPVLPYPTHLSFSFFKTPPLANPCHAARAKVNEIYGHPVPPLFSGTSTSLQSCQHRHRCLCCHSQWHADVWGYTSEEETRMSYLRSVVHHQWTPRTPLPRPHWREEPQVSVPRLRDALFSPRQPPTTVSLCPATFGFTSCFLAAIHRTDKSWQHVNTSNCNFFYCGGMQWHAPCVLHFPGCLMFLYVMEF